MPKRLYPQRPAPIFGEMAISGLLLMLIWVVTRRFAPTWFDWRQAVHLGVLSPTVSTATGYWRRPASHRLTPWAAVLIALIGLATLGMIVVMRWPYIEYRTLAAVVVALVTVPLLYLLLAALLAQVRDSITT